MTLVGLKKILEEIDINAQISQPFPHILFIGSRGSGKTTLANYITAKVKGRAVVLNATTVTFQQLQSIILSLKKNQIIFIDEIHRLHPKIEELLYHPMESGEMYISGFKFKVPPFTLIGATTRPDLITKPLTSRFKLQIYVPRYSLKQLARIVRNQFPQYSLSDCIQIAHSTAVPREALNLGFRLKQLSKSVVEGLTFLGYRDGLNKQERDYLGCVKTDTRSLASLSAQLLIPEPSVTELEERLIQLGLVDVGGRGRRITALGLARLNSYED